MACRLIGAKSLSELMMEYCWMDPGVGTNFSEIVMKIHTFSFKKMHLKMLSWKWWPSCLIPNELNLLIGDISPVLPMLSCTASLAPCQPASWPGDSGREPRPAHLQELSTSDRSLTYMKWREQACPTCQRRIYVVVAAADTSSIIPSAQQSGWLGGGGSYCFHSVCLSVRPACPVCSVCSAILTGYILYFY